MRLSQFVQERGQGIDAFNADDFKFVGSKLATDPNRLILVGGQAIETWGLYFDVLPPTGERHPLTEDADFYGGKEDAKWLCKLLGKEHTELILTKDFDPSPNTAIAYVRRPDGRVLFIDFLRTIVGLTPAQIRDLAVPVNVGDIRFSVLHPLLCLESRLANLEHLSWKRNTNGIMQAHWAVDIVAAYLRKMKGEGATDREMIKACHYVAEASEYRSGPYCFHGHGIDPLNAVSAEILDMIGGRFVTEDWRRRTDRIREKRAKKVVSYKVELSPPALPELEERMKQLPGSASAPIDSRSDESQTGVA